MGRKEMYEECHHLVNQQLRVKGMLGWDEARWDVWRMYVSEAMAECDYDPKLAWLCLHEMEKEDAVLAEMHKQWGQAIRMLDN